MATMIAWRAGQGGTVEREALDALEVVVMAGVALTTEALAAGRSGLELTLPMWRVLVVLGATDDGATVSEVSRRIGVTLPATSRQLRRLERRGLVAIDVDERDRRAMRARLTEAGVAFRDRVMQARRAGLADALRPLRLSAGTVRELSAIAALLRPTP
jgi:DNA-binding MarR family transcriptional regulator